jgi:serpin B
MNKKTLIIVISTLIIASVSVSVFVMRKEKTPITPVETRVETVKPAPSVADETGTTAQGVDAVVNANNQFALDLYSKYRTKEKDNIFFSPYSISTALAMTYEGAKGQTAQEIKKVFHYPEDENVRRPNFAKIYNEINKKDKKYTLYTANALWVQKDFPFLREYLDAVEKYYAGKATNLDFVEDTEGSRITINNWVADQTNKRINDLIPEGAIKPLTRLLLTNAIYFKGDWVLKFDKSKTREEDFNINQNETVKVQMMSLTGEKAKFNYAETENLQILEMPYSGKELSMLIFLPKDNSLEALEKSLTLEKLNEWKKLLKEERIDVYMPKFKFETKYFMSQDLKEMGMATAFNCGMADFSGMTGRKDLCIDEVIHQAFVEVNEEGTEAAGATAVNMITIAVSPLFRADHPFIFLIQQTNTGNILFIGRVINPSL